MTPSPAALQRPPLTLLACVLAIFALVLASFAISPAAFATDEASATAQPTGSPSPSADEQPTDTVTVDEAASTAQPEPPAAPPVDDDVSTAEPTEPAPPAAPAPGDFEVEYYGPDSCDSSYNVSVSAFGATDGLRVALQEQVAGTWVTIRTERFYGDYEDNDDYSMAFVYSDELAEGETATFQVVVYHRSAPDQRTVLHGPLEVTGVSTEECDGGEWNELPEDQWTVAEVACGTVTFTNRADQPVLVVWGGLYDDDEDLSDNFVYIGPDTSYTLHTSEHELYWLSLAGVNEVYEPSDYFEPIGEDIYFAGEGDLQIPQNCTPGKPADPAKPADPGKPAHPAKPTHTVPGKVQTDGGASTGTLALGLALMTLAGLGLVRARRAA